MINTFPARLREIIELDYYLVRLQRSMAHKIRDYDELAMPDARYVAESMRSRIVEMRKVYRQEINTLGLDIPIIHSALGVKYLPRLPLLRLLSRIDIVRAHSVAALWRYCGQGVSDGTTDTVASIRRPGSVTFSTSARREMAEIRKILVSKDTPYRAEYVRYKQYLLGQGLNATHAFRRAARYVGKLWLKHLWLVWRRQEKLPIPGGHPEDRTNLAAAFGWR